ncbi:MAG: GGDEF domain-containing protein, partial [Blastochloris sp.]|nr:GGDEF domain-containing protein [Blastochloris sp.]
GLLNRRAMYEHAEAELSRAACESLPMSLILLDVDHFKEVNDQYGHLIGDQMLYLVAATIAHNKRPTDWAGRWGGEEFFYSAAQYQSL